MVDVEQWAELRREYFVAGKSIKRLVRETGLSKNTIRRALRSEAPPRYRRASRPGVLEPFKAEIHRLLADDPKLPGVRVRELLEPLGLHGGQDGGGRLSAGGATAVRAAAAGRFSGRSIDPGEVCQFDVWQPRGEIPVGHGQTRSGWVVVACLGYSRAGAGVLVFCKETEDLLAGIAGCLTRLGALPRDVGVGSPGRDPRPRRPTVGRVRGVLWAAARRVAVLRAR